MLNRRMTAFVGLDNFYFLLRRPTFQMVIFQSCLFGVTAVVSKAVLGFTMAHLMHGSGGRHQRILRGLLLVPCVVPLALFTLTWCRLFEPSYSAVYRFLRQVGL